MIDLHMHTTASDGRSTPVELVDEAWRVGIRFMSITDHDTMAGHADAAARAASLGMGFLRGIEITAVFDGRAVHVLGYGLRSDAPALTDLITRQCASRLARAREIAARLARAGAEIDVDRLVATAEGMSGKAIARPQLAQLLCEAGHVATVSEAFDKYLGPECPAFVPHTGASPLEVVALVLQGGGVPSLAHPGVLNRDELIPLLAQAGLPCLEVYHSAHDARLVDHYRELARRYDLVCTGGSDYHGEGTRRAEFFGRVSVPPEEFKRLATLVGDTAFGGTSDHAEMGPPLDRALPT